MSIEFGKYVAAGDRFEVIRPGYAVTKLQASESRRKLPILSARLLSDRRTVVVETEPMREAVTYAVSLPALRKASPTDSTIEDSNIAEQTVETAFTLQGVLASWKSGEESPPVREIVAPRILHSLSPRSNREVDRQKSAGEAWPSQGTIVLRTQLDPRGLFYPAVQPGATLDYPPRDDRFIENAGFRISSQTPFQIIEHGGSIVVSSESDGRFTSTISIRSPDVAMTDAKPVPIGLTIDSNHSIPELSVEWFAKFANGKQAEGLLHFDRFLLPWATSEGSDATRPHREDSSHG
jgi:hypothetical protein